jgi:hypothetical protein
MGWASPGQTTGPGPLDHHDEENPAFVPTTDPTHAPAIDAIAEGGGCEQAQEVSLNFHGIHELLWRTGQSRRVVLAGLSGWTRTWSKRA